LADAGAATHTSGYVPTPVDVTLAGLDTSYQAKLIHVASVTIDPATPTPFAASTNYTISDPSGVGVLRTAYADLDYINTEVPITAKNYTGICLQYNTAYQLVPRSLAEITDAGPLDTPINVTAVLDANGNDVDLSWDAVPGATSYKVVWDIDTNGAFSNVLDIVNAPNHTYVAVGDAANFGIRFYRIIAQ
jgi:hypothetical protein